LISEGRFREDLFYRLNVISITSPPLRERKEDILELSLHFLQQGAERLGKRITHITDSALEVMLRYNWPGNVRQLENVVERACVLAEGESITLAELPRELLQGQPTIVMDSKPRPGQGIALGNLTPSSREPLVPKILEPAGAFREDKGSESDRLKQALGTTNGNKAEAARLLGMPRSTFFSKLKKYNLG